MASKQEIIKMVDECVKVEESVIPLYSKHIENTVFLSGFDKGSASEVRRILDRVKTDSEKHKVIFDGLLTKIKESSKDVY